MAIMSSVYNVYSIDYYRIPALLRTGARSKAALFRFNPKGESIPADSNSDHTTTLQSLPALVVVRERCFGEFLSMLKLPGPLLALLVA